MKHSPCRDSVGSPVAEGRVQIFQPRLIEEGDDEQNRAKEDESRAERLQNLSHEFCAGCEISSDPKIDETRKQDEDMPRAIQQARPVRDSDHVIVKLVHVLPRQQKGNHDQNAESEMDSLHRRMSPARLRSLLLGGRVFEFPFALFNRVLKGQLPSDAERSALYCLLLKFPLFQCVYDSLIDRSIG